MTETTGGHNALPKSVWPGVLACVSYFVLASMSSPITYFVTNLFDLTRHQSLALGNAVMLAGGLFLIFGFWPAVLGRTYAKSYRGYVKRIGLLGARSRAQRFTSLAFWVVMLAALIIEVRDPAWIAVVEAYWARPLWLITFAAVQTGVVEELVFRGLAFDLLEWRFSIWGALLVPAALFGFAHVAMGPGRIATTAWVGFLFAGLRWQTGSVWGCVAMHFLLNLGTPVPAWLGWLAGAAVALGLHVASSRNRRSSVT
jgi:membrane protease YdiL (CAAX protease family)